MLEEAEQLIKETENPLQRERNLTLPVGLTEIEGEPPIETLKRKAPLQMTILQVPVVEKSEGVKLGTKHLLRESLKRRKTASKSETLGDVGRKCTFVYKRAAPKSLALDQQELLEKPSFYVIPQMRGGEGENGLSILLQTLNAQVTEKDGIALELEQYISENYHQNSLLQATETQLIKELQGLGYLCADVTSVIKLKIINQNNIEFEERSEFWRITKSEGLDNPIFISNTDKPLFYLTHKFRLHCDPQSGVSDTNHSLEVISTLVETGPLADLARALRENADDPHLGYRVPQRTNIHIPLSSILVAGLFVMLAFAVYASSLHFGLAVPGGLLMTGILASPWVVFGLAAFALGFISHLVMRSIKPSMVDTPISQAMASVGEAEKILQNWIALEENTEGIAVDTPTRNNFARALQASVKHAKELLFNYSKGLLSFGNRIKDDNYIEACNFLRNDIKNTQDIITHKQKLLEIFTQLKNSTIDPDYRSPYPRSWLIFWSSISFICLAGCVLTLSAIFHPGIITGMAGSMLLTAILGVISWLSARHVLRKISGGPYATLTAVSGIGVVTFVILWATGGAGLSLSVLIPVISSLVSLLIVCARMAYRNANLDPQQRVEKLASLRNSPSSFKLLLSVVWLTSLVACVVPLSFILSGVSAWWLMLAIPSGCLCLGLTDYALNRISNSPFATLAALSGIGLITTLLVGPLMGVGLSLLWVSLGLLTTLGVSTFMVYQHKTTQRTGQEGERLLSIVKIVLMTGFLFLAFMSMAMLFNLGNLGQLSGMLAFAYGVMGKMLGYGGYKIGLQWASAFFIGIFATSGFIIFELLKSFLQKPSISNAEFEQQKKWMAVGSSILKFMFTVGTILLFTATSAFVSGGMASMLPVFLVVAGVMPLFSGNARLPYFESFNNFWNNQLFAVIGINMGLGISPIVDKNLESRRFKYAFREFGVVAILFSVPVILFSVGSISGFSFAVLGVGVGVTTCFRVGTMLLNAREPLFSNQLYLQQKEKTTDAEIRLSRTVQKGKRRFSIAASTDSDPSSEPSIGSRESSPEHSPRERDAKRKESFEGEGTQEEKQNLLYSHLRPRRRTGSTYAKELRRLSMTTSSGGSSGSTGSAGETPPSSPESPSHVRRYSDDGERKKIRKEPRRRSNPETRAELSPLLKSPRSHSVDSLSPPRVSQEGELFFGHLYTSFVPLTRTNSSENGVEHSNDPENTTRPKEFSIFD